MNLRPSKIVCVGRSYVADKKELENIKVDNPLLFIKPPSSLNALSEGISWNQELGSCYHECEVVLRIDRKLSQENDAEKAKAAVGAITLGLDLTLRDLQNELKAKGQPWERCKAYDGSCLLADWVNLEEISCFNQIKFDFKVNGITRHQGDTSLIMYDIGELLAHISQSFTLEPGDVVMTGCPIGVDALATDDRIEMNLYGKTKTFNWQTFVN